MRDDAVVCLLVRAVVCSRDEDQRRYAKGTFYERTSGPPIPFVMGQLAELLYVWLEHQ